MYIDESKFSSLFKFAKFYDGMKESLSVQHPRGVMASIAIDAIRMDLQRFINANYDPNDFSVSNSIGRPSMPRVPWVSISLRRMRVSSSPSYSICFGRKGDGFVHGLMISASINNSNLTPVLRSVNDGIVDVDGGKLKYNDKFINPEEVKSSDLDEQKIITHMIKSLELLQSIWNAKDKLYDEKI